MFCQQREARQRKSQFGGEGASLRIFRGVWPASSSNRRSRYRRPISVRLLQQRLRKSAAQTMRAILTTGATTADWKHPSMHNPKLWSYHATSRDPGRPTLS